ncbi:MAG: response regulator transcription factor [Nitriliruptoraceae bacterium]
MSRIEPSPRVLVVDDHELFGESLKIALSASDIDTLRAPDLSPAELLLLTDRFEPHVVLLDLQLGGGMSGIDLVEPLRARRAHVVMVTGVNDPAELGACIHAGALSVVSKVVPLESLVRAVAEALEGRSVNDTAERARFVEALAVARRRKTQLDAMFGALTNAEREVFAGLAHGRSAETIARLRVVSVRTVRSQIEAILAKLEVNSQLAAVALANEAGWFSSDRQQPTPSQSRAREDQGTTTPLSRHDRDMRTADRRGRRVVTPQRSRRSSDSSAA